MMNKFIDIRITKELKLMKSSVKEANNLRYEASFLTMSKFSEERDFEWERTRIKIRNKKKCKLQNVALRVSQEKIRSYMRCFA